MAFQFFGYWGYIHALGPRVRDLVAVTLPTEFCAAVVLGAMGIVAKPDSVRVICRIKQSVLDGAVSRGRINPFY